MKIRSPLISHTRGFSLVELLITIIIAGVLVTVAGPGFMSLIEGTAASTVVSDLHSSLVYARSEAIKREADVALVNLSSGWNDGWEVFIDVNNNGSKDGGEQVLLTYNVSNPNVSITAAAGASSGMRYRPSGRASADFDIDGDFFTIAASDTTRYVCFSLTGRPHVKEDPC